jgi:LytS/YehU family sensor histidine kinase
VAVAAFIGFYLLPKYFYANRLSLFWGLTIGIITLLYFVEELVLEPIIVGGERAEHISGFFSTLVGIVPIIFMVVAFNLLVDAYQKQKELEELKLVVKDSELKYLKNQINPHFLFNHLNNLYSYSLEQSAKTPIIILELSAVLRYMLYDCKDDYVRLKDEIEHLENFIELNKLPLENRAEIKFHKEIQSSMFSIAPLILSVFVENAFKHSAAGLSSGIYIDVAVKCDESGKLTLACRNNFATNRNVDGITKGLGLKNVKKRLALVYPNMHELSITETNSEYFVELSLQLAE